MNRSLLKPIALVMSMAILFQACQQSPGLAVNEIKYRTLTQQELRNYKYALKEGFELGRANPQQSVESQIEQKYPNDEGLKSFLATSKRIETANPDLRNRLELMAKEGLTTYDQIPLILEFNDRIVNLQSFEELDQHIAWFDKEVEKSEISDRGKNDLKVFSQLMKVNEEVMKEQFQNLRGGCLDCIFEKWGRIFAWWTYLTLPWAVACVAAGIENDSNGGGILSIVCTVVGASILYDRINKFCGGPC